MSTSPNSRLLCVCVLCVRVTVHTLQPLPPSCCIPPARCCTRPQDGFDTSPGCPNVATHSIRVRRMLLGLAPRLARAKLRAIPHNMRHCNSSLSCQAELKRHTAADMSHSRFCAVASGDTPTTGRLYDAIACGCVPLILADHLQLPFPVTAPVPADAYGVRIPESEFFADPDAAIRRVLDLSPSAWLDAQRRVLLARQQLAYRTPGSLVATSALREAWATCLQQRDSKARPPSQVTKC